MGGDLISVETADEPLPESPSWSATARATRNRCAGGVAPPPPGHADPEAGPPGAETKPVRHGGYEVARSTEERLTTEQPRPRTKPPVRKLAKELGIDLAAVDPTGPGAVITRADVERAAAQRQSAPTAPSRSSRYAA